MTKRWQTLGLFLSVILAFSIRFPIAFKVFGSMDMLTWNLVAKLLSEHRNPYMESPYFPYPPLWMILLYFADSASALILWPLYAVAKTWLILSDITTVVLLYYIAKGNSSSTNPLAASLIFAVYPISVFITSVHGNFDPLVTVLLLASTYCLLNLDPYMNIFWSGIFLGLSIYGKIWPLFVLPAFLTQITGWKNRILFSFIAVLPTISGLGPMYVINPEVILTNVQASARSGWWGFTGLAYLFPNCIPTTLVSDFVTDYGRYLILLLPWAMFLKKSPGWSLVDKIGISLLLFYILTPSFGPQYLAWIVPFAILSRKRTPILWGIYASAYSFLDYGFNYTLGQFIVVLSNSQSPVLEAFMTNQFNVVWLRFPLWIITMVWLREALAPTNLNTPPGIRSFSKVIEHLAVRWRTLPSRILASMGTRQRRLGSLTIILALILAFGYYTVFMYPTGLSQFRYCTDIIEQASPAVKEFVDLSNLVQDWEVDLAQRYKPAHLYAGELGSELCSRWGVSVGETDVKAWTARMVIYENFLNMYGLWIYLPGPQWTRTVWYRYGTGMIILAAIALLWLGPFWNAIERLTAVLRTIVNVLRHRIRGGRNEP